MTVSELHRPVVEDPALTEGADLAWSGAFDEHGYTIAQPDTVTPGLAEGQGGTVTELKPATFAEAPVVDESGRVSRLRMAARGLKQWVRGKFGRGAQAEGNENLSESDSFWSEKHSAVTAQGFSEQVAYARMDPNSRQNMIMADPNTVLPTIHANGARRATVRFTEREGIIDLDNFLLQVMTVAQANQDPTAREMADQANRMRSNFNFLGEQEYDKACEGMAMAWKEYLAKHEDGAINLFDPHIPEHGVQRSYTIVLQDIKAKFAELTKDSPEIAAKLRAHPEQWTDSENAKLVVVDDWLSSGNTITNNVAKAVRAAELMAMPGLAKKVEAHVLIARKGEPQRDWTIADGTKHFKLRSYFETESRDPGFSPSGAHASVDYTFEAPLQKMNT